MIFLEKMGLKIESFIGKTQNIYLDHFTLELS